MVPRAEQWKFGNKRPCGLMVTSHGPRWPNFQPQKSSDWDFQSKLWDVCGGKAWLEDCTPSRPMFTRKPSEFRLASASGVLCRGYET
jgi:hypothetical protein